MQEGEPVVDLHHELIPDPVMDRIEALDELIRKLEDRILSTQFELEITEDKLRRAEDELHQVEDRIEMPPAGGARGEPPDDSGGPP